MGFVKWNLRRLDKPISVAFFLHCVCALKRMLSFRIRLLEQIEALTWRLKGLAAACDS